MNERPLWNGRINGRSWPILRVCERPLRTTSANQPVSLGPRPRKRTPKANNRPKAEVRGTATRTFDVCALWRRQVPRALTSRRPPPSGTRTRSVLGILVGVTVEQGSDHPLIRNLRPRGMRLKEIDALLTEGDGDLDTVFPQDKLIRRWKEVFHHLYATERLICVLSSVLHRVSCPCASIRHR